MEAIATKERPIIFRGAMVAAILAATKTQTRRVIKPQPAYGVRWNAVVVGDYGGWTDGHGAALRCPYHVGQKLWVRETWAAIWPDISPVPLEECRIEYRADTNAAYPGDWPAEDAKGNADAPKWQSSMFMPRWASRLTLEVTDVRAQGVQDISTEDMIAEGIVPNMFVELWDSTNAKRGYTWESNPFVFAITFKQGTYQ